MSARDLAPGLCVAYTGAHCPLCRASAEHVWMTIVDRPGAAPLRLCRSCATLIADALRPAARTVA